MFLERVVCELVINEMSMNLEKTRKEVKILCAVMTAYAYVQE